MGNQPEKMGRRERANTADGQYIRPRVCSSVDEECPVQMKIAKPDSKTGASAGGDGSQPPSGTPSMQFENTSELPVVIKWTGGGQPKNVAIAGSWDSWGRRIPLVKSHEDFSTIVELPEGRHEFKFMVDSQWVCDNNLPKTDNKLGTQNNVISVDRADFQVFDALAKDLESTDAGKAKKANAPSQTESVNERELEKNLTFTQRVPDRATFERAHHPPMLPPHLLQVILNKDTPVQCDPNVLPEPNHVMLNHLYALSIKDGVMVLSATHRYRRKYVTTLLYKPIDS